MPVDEGFARFVEQEYDRLRRALVLYCGDAEVARELTQDAFARAYERWSRVQAMDRPAAWVQTVAETAVALGIAETAVRAATFKAIARLRTHFDVPEEVVERA